MSNGEMDSGGEKICVGSNSSSYKPRGLVGFHEELISSAESMKPLDLKIQPVDGKTQLTMKEWA